MGAPRDTTGQVFKLQGRGPKAQNVRSPPELVDPKISEPPTGQIMSESFGDDSLFQSDDEGETKMSVGQAATNVTATAMAAAAVPVGAVSAQAASNRMPIPTDPLRMPSVPKLPSPTSMADQAKSKAKAAASKA